MLSFDQEADTGPVSNSFSPFYLFTDNLSNGRHICLRNIEILLGVMYILGFKIYQYFAQNKTSKQDG